MAKYESYLKGSFDAIINDIDAHILKGSLSATFEDGSDFNNGNVQCAVRVYERYSIIGNNRVSLSVTLISDGNGVFLTAITSGGSQAMFFKFNTFGEESFLEKIVEAVRKYED